MTYQHATHTQYRVYTHTNMRTRPAHVRASDARIAHTSPEQSSPSTPSPPPEGMEWRVTASQPIRGAVRISHALLSHALHCQALRVTGLLRKGDTICSKTWHAHVPEQAIDFLCRFGKKFKCI